MNRVGVVLFVVLAIACSNKDDVDKLNFLKRGNEAFAKGDNQAAKRYYNEALIIDSAFIDAWYNRGLVEMKENQFDAAIYSFNTALQIKPDYAEAQLNYIKANLAVGQYFACLDGLESLEQQWPDTSITHFTRGLVYHEMKDNEKALQSFFRSLELDSMNIETQVNIANIYYHEDRFPEAIDLLKYAISQDADNAQAYNILAMCYVGTNDFYLASSTIETASSIDREDPYILNNKGYISLRQGELNDAEKLFVRSMKRDPYNGWVYRNMGLLRVKEGKMDDAERMFAKAYEIDPEIEYLKRNYIDVLVFNNKYRTACTIARSDSLLAQQYNAISQYCTD